LRHALPVVAFDAGGVKEWLVDGVTGYVVPWMDRDRFAARLEELLRNKPLARRMGECGRQRAAERYDFSRYVTGLENMFERVRAEAA
jgi:glycosyltransferase involved in cell wall biosynthesis